MNNISTARIKKGLTQGELATAIGVSQQAISKYETGVREPDVDTLKNLSKILDCSIDYLLGNHLENDNTNNIPKEFIDPFTARTFVKSFTIFRSEGFNTDKFDDTEIIEFANELLKQAEMVGYKYKK